jgi:hypothetical protein
VFCTAPAWAGDAFFNANDQDCAREALTYGSSPSDMAAMHSGWGPDAAWVRVYQACMHRYGITCSDQVHAQSSNAAGCCDNTGCVR